MALNLETHAPAYQPPAPRPGEPSAHGDPMGTPASDEKVLWKGRPDRALLARTVFHTRKVGIYFAILVAVWSVLGRFETALVCAGLGLAALAILHAIASWSQRTTLYILTDTRLIMRIGMAIETRINVPLKHIRSASLRTRSGGHGDIVMTLGGERLLGYVLLWPHVRPWRLNRPEPMLRAIPDAANVARIIANARAAIGPITRGEIDPQTHPAIPGTQLFGHPRASGQTAAVHARGESELEGASA